MPLSFPFSPCPVSPRAQVAPDSCKNRRRPSLVPTAPPRGASSAGAPRALRRRAACVQGVCPAAGEPGQRARCQPGRLWGSDRGRRLLGWALQPRRIGGMRYVLRASRWNTVPGAGRGLWRGQGPSGWHLYGSGCGPAGTASGRVLPARPLYGDFPGGRAAAGAEIGRAHV